MYECANPELELEYSQSDGFVIVVEGPHSPRYITLCDVRFVACGAYHTSCCETIKVLMRRVGVDLQKFYSVGCCGEDTFTFTLHHTFIHCLDCGEIVGAVDDAFYCHACEWSITRESYFQREHLIDECEQCHLPTRYKEYCRPCYHKTP